MKVQLFNRIKVVDQKKCKRLNTQEDKDKLRNDKIDIFENTAPIMKVIEKYFQHTTDISISNNNVAFLNTTCENVSNEIRKLENRKDEYQTGEFLIQFSILSITSSILEAMEFFSLRNVKTEVLRSLDVGKVRSNSIFS